MIQYLTNKYDKQMHWSSYIRLIKLTSATSNNIGMKMQTFIKTSRGVHKLELRISDYK